MAFTPTQEQLEANRIGTHISLFANAGSGKTSVLIERYISHINSSDDINKIVAITFTEKAASEMLERVVNKIDNKFNDAKNNTEKSKFRAIRRRLSSAKIMTIHSFCTNILRDYALDAELEPNFQILDEVQKFLINTDAIYNAFDFIINSSENVLPKFLEYNKYKELLFTRYTPKEIKEFISLILSKPDIFESVDKLYNQTEEEYCNLIYKEYYCLTNELVSEFITYLNLHIDSFEKVKWEIQDNIPITRNLVAEILNDYKQFYNNSDINYSLYIKIASSIFELCHIYAINRQGSTYRRFFIPMLFAAKDIKGNKSQFEFKNEICKSSSEYKDKLVEILSAVANTNSLHIHYNLCKIILEITKKAKEEIDALKKKKNGIDFDDMLHKTRNLLINNPSIAEAISSQYTEIMVDEFQDTNNTQYDIIKALVPTINSESVEVPITPKLFIVGDDKQSIYRFRSADVQVFLDARDDIEKSNKNYFAAKAKELKDFGSLKLSATFRTQPVITSFVNKVCGTLFNKIQESSGIKYNDLVCGRNSDFYLQKIAKNMYLDEKFGSVNFLLSASEKNTNNAIKSTKIIDDNENDDENSDIEEEVTLIEANLIAEHIQNNIVCKNSKYLLQTDTQNPDKFEAPQYKDIAILFRSRTKLQKLTTALNDKGIPFELSSGTGFYDKQEIFDLTTFLTFLNNKKDDLALLGVMLSSFYSLSYADILNIGSSDGKTLWERFENFYNFVLAPNQSVEVVESNKKIIFLYEQLSELIDITPNISITHLIRTILGNTFSGTNCSIGQQETGLEDVSNSTPNWLQKLMLEQNEQAREQILSNIEKFISIARDYQNRGWTTLSDFVAELKILSNIGGKESEADTSSDNTVKLYTIHSSKGLEFPIVILYNLNSKRLTIKTPLINKEYGLGFSSLACIEENEQVNSLATYLITSKEKELEYAEQLRLLYVAMTRAKDHLILSAHLVKNTKDGFRKDDSDFKLIANTIGLDDDTIQKIIYENDNSTILFNNELKILAQNPDGYCSYNIEYNSKVNSKNEIEKYDENDIFFNEISPLKNENLGVVKNIKYKIKPANIDFVETEHIYSFSTLNSINKMLQGNEYDANNRIKKILDFKDSSHNYNSDNIEPPKHIIGANKGTVLHNVLQQINIWYTNNIIDKDKINKLLFAEIMKIDSNLISDSEILISNIESILNTQLLQEYKEQLENAKFELNLTIPLGNNFYTGFIDCVIQDNMGNYEIWDWKSNENPVITDLKEVYSLQMKMYIYFLLHLYPKQDKCKAMLLFTELAQENAPNDAWTAEFIYCQADKESLKLEISDYIDNATLRVVAKVV